MIRVLTGAAHSDIGPQALAQFREFLDAAPKGKPFVLQLCFHDPHRPLDRGAIPQPHDPAKLKLPAHWPDLPGMRPGAHSSSGRISTLRNSIGWLSAWRAM